MDQEESSLITDYFHMGLTYDEIRAHLLLNHNIDISDSTLKRRLKVLGLTRRKDYDIDRAYNFIEEEVSKSGCNNGCQWMYLKCIEQQIKVPRETVREIMREIDPIGIECRKKRKLKRRLYKNKGPNYMWHFDGYDKLKPFGICISGCVDGYSRQVMWLEAGTTNNEPRVISGYYLNVVEKFKGTALTVRFDGGTENVKVKDFQELFRKTVTSKRPPTIRGPSTRNQRIERFWRDLRNQVGQFYMDLFHYLEDEGLFCGDYLDKSLIQFFFMEIIQEELYKFAKIWSMHRIRKCKSAVAPHGKVLNMYFIPEIYKAKNYIVGVKDTSLQNLKSECVYQELPCNPRVYDACNYIMQMNELNSSRDVEEATLNYVTVRNELRQNADYLDYLEIEGE